MTDSTAKPRKRFTVDALFSDTRPQAAGVKDLTEAKLIDISRIQPDPAQPRRTFDPDKLEELASSIKVEGVLQPIVVRFDTENDRYVIVHGERRWRASRQVGLENIPAIVRDVPVERRLLQQLMENVIRDDLNAVDRAAALRGLRSQLGDPSWDVVADAVGIKRSRLFQLLGTGKLTPEAQDDIRDGRLSEKQSRALQGLSETRQEALRDAIVTDNLSAQSAMRLARAFREVDFTPDDNLDAAKAALANVRAFVFATNETQLQQQTSILFQAIRLAATGTSVERGKLRHLASSVESQTFKSERLTSDINAIARTLATLPEKPEARPADIEARLRELQQTLNALLDGEESTSPS